MFTKIEAIKRTAVSFIRKQQINYQQIKINFFENPFNYLLKELFTHSNKSAHVFY